jgi:hypothetical protein
MLIMPSIMLISQFPLEVEPLMMRGRMTLLSIDLNCWMSASAQPALV